MRVTIFNTWSLPFLDMPCPCCGGAHDDNEDEIICQCSHITRDEITETIIEMGSMTVNEVKKYLRDTTHDDCTQEAGSCHNKFQSIIQEALNN